MAATETIILWCYNETVRVLNYVTKKPGLNLCWYLKILFINSIESGRWCEEERKTRSIRLCASPIKYAQQKVSADLPQNLYYLIAVGLRDPEISRFLSFFASLSWKKNAIATHFPEVVFACHTFREEGSFLSRRVSFIAKWIMCSTSRVPLFANMVCNAC